MGWLSLLMEAFPGSVEFWLLWMGFCHDMCVRIVEWVQVIPVCPRYKGGLPQFEMTVAGVICSVASGCSLEPSAEIRLLHITDSSEV